MLLFTPKQADVIDWVIMVVVFLLIAALTSGNPFVLLLFWTSMWWSRHWGFTYHRRLDEERIRNSPPKLSESSYHEQVNPDQNQG
jgi:hypothetical protein